MFFYSLQMIFSNLGYNCWLFDLLLLPTNLPIRHQFVRLSDQQPPHSKSLKPLPSSPILMFPVDSIKSSSSPNPNGLVH